MTNTILLATTSENLVLPILCSDFGELIVEGGDSYWTLDGATISTIYTVEGPNSTWRLGGGGALSAKSSISIGLNASGDGSTIEDAGRFCFGNDGTFDIATKTSNFLYKDLKSLIRQKCASEGDQKVNGTDAVWGCIWGTETTFRYLADGTVYCKKVIDSDGYELGNVAQGLIALRNAVLATSDLDELKALIFSTLMEIKPVPIPPDDPPE